MTRPRLTQDALDVLAKHRDGVGTPYLDEHTLLAQHGLLEIKTGRFGAFTRLTEAGRKHLARTASSGGRAATKPRGPGGTRGVLNASPEAATGATAASSSVRSASMRGAEPRTSRTSATKAKPHGQKRR